MKKIISTFILALCVSLSSFGYSLSNKGLNHIRTHESCSLTAYWDSNGYSIGYGHHGKDVKKGMKISKSRADQLLKQDIRTAEEGAKRIIASLPYKYKFSQAFFDGLVDLVYNCGESGIKNSIFYKRLSQSRVRNGVFNKSDYDFTMASVKTLKISAKGHIKRRQNTYKMMIS